MYVRVVGGVERSGWQEEGDEMQKPGGEVCHAVRWVGETWREARNEWSGRESEEAHTPLPLCTAHCIGTCTVIGGMYGWGVQGGRVRLWTDTSSSCRPWRLWTTWLRELLGERSECGVVLVEW